MAGVEDLKNEVNYAFPAEALEEDKEEESNLLDAILSEEDRCLPLPVTDEEKHREADLEILQEQKNPGAPHADQQRKESWLKLTREERVSLRRLHTMLNHTSKPQKRMLRLAEAAPVIKAVDHFKCAVCESHRRPRKPAIVRPPPRFKFNAEIGLAIFEVKDPEGKRWQILHIIDQGTLYQTAEVLGITLRRTRHAQPGCVPAGAASPGLHTTV